MNEEEKTSWLFTFKLDSILLAEFKYIFELQEDTLSSMVRYLIQEFVAQREKELTQNNNATARKIPTDLGTSKGTLKHLSVNIDARLFERYSELCKQQQDFPASMIRYLIKRWVLRKRGEIQRSEPIDLN